MANLANTVEANAAMTLQAMKRLSQPAGNGNGNSEGNVNDNVEGNGDNAGGALMTLVTFLKVHPPIFRGSTNPTEADNWRGPALVTAFYKKYFPESAREAKEIELMQLKQGSLSVANYTKIRTFSDLVNKARVVEEYAKTVAASNDTHGGNTSKGRGKYFHPRCQSFKRGRYAPQGQGGFKKNTQDQFQHGNRRENQSKISPDLTCVRCGRFHPYDSCKIGLGGCFNRGLPSHIERDCTRRKNSNAGQSQHQGRVFAVNANDASMEDPLMRGICLIGGKTLIALYDTGASHSFILFAKVERTKLV
ncbi:uncharacterized protein LOC107620722 [Arachis ipaensis]|uniref:uncharacterized protein LOC107620722 n=1 Tax=Arachis ipaensis TaxID=130454 RepID=UPI0007AEF2D2|nr:uncharacterized protein LOC107620722 [Arachis ipaensis]